MARRRTIDPSFWQSDSLAKLTREQRLFFIGVFSNADDEGWLKGSAEYLKATIFPYDADVNAAKISEWRDRLKKVGCIAVHSVRGEKIIEVIKWVEYQTVDKPRDSQLRILISKKKQSLQNSERVANGRDSVAVGSESRNLIPPTVSVAVDSKESKKPVPASDPGTFKIFAVRCSTLLGQHPGHAKKTHEEYANLCSTFSEDRVLAYLGKYSMERGGPSRLKDNRWAVRDFFKQAPEFLEGAFGEVTEESDIPRLEVHD